MRRRGLLSLAPAVAIAAALPAVARARPAPGELATELPAARLQGSGRMRFMGLRVYDVHLFTAAKPVPADAGGWAEVPLALEIEYARGLDGARIAERSLEEMRRQAEIDAARGERWLAAMKGLFPSVREGDRLTGVHRPGEGARFYFNGSLKGEVRDPEFTRLFFGIWLSTRTSEPALRAALLGGTS
jgi:hypothetical protein